MIWGLNDVCYGLNELGKDKKTPQIIVVRAIDDLD